MPLAVTLPLMASNVNKFVAIGSFSIFGKVIILSVGGKKMTYKELFGARIKSIREAKGWTQEKLAEKMDISPNYLSSIERGKENPTFDMLAKFADALKVEMWEMFDFGHEVGVKELKEAIGKLTKEADEEKLRAAVKILRAVVR